MTENTINRKKEEISYLESRIKELKSSIETYSNYPMTNMRHLMDAGNDPWKDTYWQFGNCMYHIEGFCDELGFSGIEVERFLQGASVFSLGYRSGLLSLGEEFLLKATPIDKDEFVSNFRKFVRIAQDNFLRAEYSKDEFPEIAEKWYTAPVFEIRDEYYRKHKVDAFKDYLTCSK